MLLSARRILLILAAVVVVCGLAVSLHRDERWLGLLVAGCGAGIALLAFGFRPAGIAPPLRESDDIGDLTPQRRAELIRGTSKFLSEMRYRYSIRVDASGAVDRRCFTAEVNGVRLGFVPALITDNTNDRQGYGYVAFVYDQRRWRGPGLPCPAGQAEAVQHAARCVSPLASDEETRFIE